MKRNIEILLTVFASFLLCGCSGFFDQVPEDRLSLEQIFQKQKYSEDFLATVYSKMIDESTVSFGIPFDACSDDLDISYDRDTYNTYKINLGNWNYFCTFTYDDKKHTPESFVKKLKNCLKKLSSRKNWVYMLVLEHSPEKERAHFHAIFHIPDGATLFH